jgi:hypothetical protein
MGFPDNPAVTALQVVNENVPYPLVSALVPDAAEISGRLITVKGQLFQWNSTIRVGDFPVSNWDAASEHPYAWAWDEMMGIAYPRHRVGDVPSAAGPNNTICKVLEYYGLLEGQWANLPKVQGLLNFTWVSESEVSFITPCVRESSVGYATVSIELQDGRKSAMLHDVADGILSDDEQFPAQLYLGDKCMVPGVFLWNGVCRPCPVGAECLPGGRVRPLADYWNTGEFSGFVKQCAWPHQGLRCKGGRLSECGEGYHGEFCADCAVGFSEDEGYCVQCKSGELQVIGGVNIGFRIIVNAGLYIAPNYLLIWALKTYTHIGSVVAIVGGLGNSEASSVLQAIYSALKLVNLDIKFSSPGCAGTSSKFTALFWANMLLMWDYAYPCLLGLPGLAAILRAAEFVAFGFDFQKSGIWLRKQRKNFFSRFLAAIGIVVEMMYLQLIKMALIAVACEPVGPEGEQVWRLKLELSQKCWSEKHIPVFAVAVLVLVIVGIGFPVGSLLLVRKWHKAGKHRKATKIEKLGHLYAHLKDAFMLKLVAYSFCLRWFLAFKSFWTSTRYVGYVLVAIPNVALMAVQIWKKPFVNMYLNRVEPVRYFAETTIGLMMLFYFGSDAIMQNVMSALVLAICLAIVVSRAMPMIKKAKGDANKLRKSITELRATGLRRATTSVHLKAKIAASVMKGGAFSASKALRKKNAGAQETSYKVTVTTGTLFGAGTSAKVHLWLIGDVEGPRIELTEKMLERSAVAAAKHQWSKLLPWKDGRLFAMGTSRVFSLPMVDVGNIYKVRVEVNAADSAWYLEAVRVDGNGGYCELFPSNQWIHPSGAPVIVEIDALSAKELPKSDAKPEPKPEPNPEPEAPAPKQAFEGPPEPSSDSESESESESDSEVERALAKARAIEEPSGESSRPWGSSEESESEEESDAEPEDLQAERKKAIAHELNLPDPDLCVREEDRDRYTCLICFRFLREPVILNNGDAKKSLLNCGHGPYCLRCIRLALRDERCPDCRQFTTLEQVIIDTRLKREMLSCKMHCKHIKRGCDWVGEFGQFASHVERCSHAGITPPPVSPAMAVAPVLSALGSRTEADGSSASAALPVPLERAPPLLGPDSWRPIDISKAVEKVPSEIAPRPRTPLSRPSSARRPHTPLSRRCSVELDAPAGTETELPPHMTSLFNRMTTPDTDRDPRGNGRLTSRESIEAAARLQAMRLLAEDTERKAREADLVSKIEARAQVSSVQHFPQSYLETENPDPRCCVAVLSLARHQPDRILRACRPTRDCWRRRCPKRRAAVGPVVQRTAGCLL